MGKLQWDARLQCNTLVFITSYLFISTTSPMKMDAVPVDPLPSGGVKPMRLPTTARRTRGQTVPMGTYSLVFLFSLIFSSSHSSSFWLSLLPRITTMRWVGQDVTNAGSDRNTGLDGRATGAYFVFFFGSSSLLYCSSYVQNIVKQQARRHGTYVGSNAGRNQGATGMSSVVFLCSFSSTLLFLSVWGQLIIYACVGN